MNLPMVGLGKERWTALYRNSKLHRDAATAAGGVRERKRRRRPATAASADEEDMRGSIVDSGARSGIGSGTASSEDRVYDVDEQVHGAGGTM